MRHAAIRIIPNILVLLPMLLDTDIDDELRQHPVMGERIVCPVLNYVKISMLLY